MDNITNDIYEYLDRLICTYDIQVKWSTALHQETPHVAQISTKSIVMNGKYGNPDLIFPLMHEIAHIIYGDPTDTHVYSYSIGAKTAIEVETNEHAIDLLISWFHQNNDYGVLYSQLYAFMEWFRIPAHLTEIVERKLTN